MNTTILLNSTDYDAWQHYVDKHPHATPYHHFGWGLAIEQAYGHQACYFSAVKDKQILGVLPLVRMKMPFFKQQFCALPYCDLGYCLADNPQVKTELIDHVVNHFKLNSRTAMQIRDTSLAPPEEPTEQRQGQKVRMVLPLPDSSAQLFASFKAKLRSQIRKAEKNGLTFEIGSSPELINQFYQVFCYNMRNLGSPVHSKKLFHALLAFYQQRMLIGVVKLATHTVGAGIILTDQQHAVIPWASTLPQYNKLAPNMMLYWQLLKYVTERGAKQFDFGRSTYGEGTYKFKQQWGATPIALDWRHWPSPRSAAIDADGPPSQLRTMVANMWRRLPLPIANYAGPPIRKYISL